MSLFSFLSKRNQHDDEKVNFNNLLNKELLFNVYNDANSMMLIYSKKEGWIGANKIFFKVLDYRNIDDFRNQNDSIRNIFLSESEEVFTENDQLWLEHIIKNKPNGYEVRLYNARNNIIEGMLSCKKVYGLKDIYTVEIEDTTAMLESKLEIKEVEKLKTKFLSNIGHEFRTPMNGILGFIELLSQTEMDYKQGQYLKHINQSSRSLMANIETLLDLSQLQGGRLTIDNANFELISQMEALIYNHFLVAKERGIKVFTFIDPKLPREFFSDLRKIKQIINALIQNAIKFTQRGGKIVVEIKLLKREPNGTCSVGFSVRDNGKGIAKYDLKHITEAFHVGDHADKKLGVGLSLCYGLVKLFKSDLNIQSEEGKGSYFNFTLDFEKSNDNLYKMMTQKKVRVILLDKTKIDEANALCQSLRSFNMTILKSNILDENIYEDVESVYIVADQSDSSWMFKLGTLKKKRPVVMLLQDDEVLQTKLTHVVDVVLKCPLFPSRISKHLKLLHSIEVENIAPVKESINKKMAALIVEDNLINQKLMKIMLEDHKITVSTAFDGNEAIEICGENEFDIIFMDIDMPEKNGIVATAEIKTKIDLNAKTPIVAFTSMAMQGDREKLLGLGFDDYISKPIQSEKLEKILNTFLKTLVV